MEDFGASGAPQLYTQDGPPDAKRPMNDVFGGENLTTEEFPVPDAMVGLIIGRGGDQITKIQADSGCRVAVVPQSTGGTTRPCTVSNFAPLKRLKLVILADRKSRADCRGEKDARRHYCKRIRQRRRGLQRTPGAIGQ